MVAHLHSYKAFKDSNYWLKLPLFSSLFPLFYDVYLNETVTFEIIDYIMLSINQKVYIMFKTKRNNEVNALMHNVPKWSDTL